MSRWCGWCCCCRPQECICCRCCLCSNCCRCPPPCLPCVCPMPQMPPMPCMGPPPPPTRIIREQVLVPYPVPVPICPTPTCPPPCTPHRSPFGGGDCCAPRTMPPECCYEPDPLIEIYHPCPPAYPKRCKFTKQKVTYFRIFRTGRSIVPGYQGHVPGLKIFGAGRTHGAATKDTCCIMSQWGKCCPLLPRRIYEQ